MSREDEAIRIMQLQPVIADQIVLAVYIPGLFELPTDRRTLFHQHFGPDTTIGIDLIEPESVLA